jgi:[protein-PII] uridylyltransferase
MDSRFHADRFKQRLARRAAAVGLAAGSASPAEQLAKLKAFQAWGDRLLQRYHRAGGGGLHVAQARTWVVDTLVSSLFAATCHRITREFGTWHEGPALLALGGYGRTEMCPASDVDVMFLYPLKPRHPQFAEMQRLCNDGVLYPLWDLGCKVGHSTRTIKDVIAEARSDVQSKNAMLEARFICGNESLSREFFKEYERFIRKENVALYIAERLADQRQRHAKYGDTVFLQEPDIKNGVGGLRDYHNTLWMTRLRLNTRVIDELLASRLLQPREHAAFVAAYAFLLRVRTELHLQSRRPTDLLNIEKQPSIALALGYRDPDIFSRVETFMRDYYRHAQAISRTSSYLEQRLALDSQTRISFSDVLQSRRFYQQKAVDGFIAQDGRLFAAHPAVFDEDPVRLIRVFRHLQRRELEPDFELARLITENAHRITPAIASSADANRAFRAILQEIGDVFRPLRLMNETGVLSRFIPEWSALHCLVQHEYYHRYTADEHTLATIREMDGVFLNLRPESARYREAIEETEIPSLIYLALLLHDIGKSSGIANHAEAGAAISLPIMERLGLPADLQEKVVFIIRNHLEMARFWQRFDVDDPDSVCSFARRFSSPDLLRMLYVLTYCDSRGTAADLWNDYKEALHSRLFSATLAHFGDDLSVPELKPMISREAITSQSPGISHDEIEAHFNLMPDRYFAHHSSAEIVLHLQMVHRLLETIAQAESLGSLNPVVEWHDDLNLGLTVVDIVTWDRAGLFYKLAGAFSLAGLNIVSSKALTRADHITIDTFYVTDASGGPVQNEGTLAAFQSHLEDVLIHNKDLLPAIRKLADERARRTLLRKPSLLPAPLPPRVEVYHEISLRRTIIEVQCSDEIGLLYRLAKAIFDNGFDITFARISTERHVAVDTFHIEPVPAIAAKASEHLLALRSKLDDIVQSVATSAR